MIELCVNSKQLCGTKPQSLADIVETVSKNISEQTLLVTVKRGFVLDAAIRSAKRSVFSPTKMLKVCAFICICLNDTF